MNFAIIYNNAFEDELIKTANNQQQLQNNNSTNVYKSSFKQQAPYLSFGLGAGAGTLTANKFFPRGGKFARRASVLAPIIGGTLGYLGATKATGQKLSPNARTTLMTLGGGAASLGLYHKFRKGSYNQLKSNIIGGLGGLSGTMSSAAISDFSNRRRRKNNTNLGVKHGL